MQWCDVYDPKVITIFFQLKLKHAVFSETHVSLTESFDFFSYLSHLDDSLGDWIILE